MYKKIAACLIFIALAACTKVGTTTTQSAGGAKGHNSFTQPHHLRIADGSGDIDSLNPHLFQETPLGNISEMTMAWLIRWDSHNKPYPELATAVPTVANGGISKDGLTITYHIRGHVKWADGAPFDADDVVFSANVVNNTANDEGGRFDQLASIQEPDKNTVIVHLKKPYAAFLETFFSSCCANPCLLPKHLLSKYASINNVPYNSLPVGIGPFKFARWDKGKQVVLVANPLYWRGRPKLDKIIYKVVPNRDELLSQLAAHQVDMWYQFSGTYLDRVQAIPGYTLIRQPSYAWNHLDFNLSHPVLSDVRVRQALAYALDKQRLLQTPTYGQERIATEDQPTFMWSYDPGVKTYPHDPQKARQLLQQAGWSPGRDGIMIKNGQRLSLLTVSNVNNATRRKEVVQLQEMARDAGIELSIKEYQSDVLFAPVGEGGILQGGKFDLSLAGWFSGVDPDDSSQLTCANVAPAGYNYSRYCSPEMESAQKAALTNYDLRTRKAAYYRIQELLARDVPEIYTYYQRMMHPINSNFKGFAPNPSIESWNAWQWSI